MNSNIKSEEISRWIKKTVSSAGFSKVVIGLSGGIDSALSATLAVLALGVENVFPVLLPYGQLNPEGVVDALLVASFLRIPKERVTQIDISESVDELLKNVILEGEKRPVGSHHDTKDPIALLQNDNVRRGNIMARVRMIYLFDAAKKHNALVCGTENKTEHYLGYFTRFGDEASDIEPIRSLYKTQVWDMAKELGVPGQIITKAPTAGLWEGQTDEGEFGFSYKQADQVLHYVIDEHLSLDKIVAKGIDEHIVKKVLDRVAKNDFKHALPHVYQ